MKATLERYETWWLQRVDGASLSLFRILFGVFLILDAIFFWKDIDAYFPNQIVYLRMPLFSWWPRLGTTASSVVLFVLLCSGVLIALGFAVRWAAALATLVHLHFMLWDMSFYLNHLVLVLLLSFVLIFVPSDRYYALRPSQSPQKDRTIARYELFAVIGLFLMTYFFGGIHKLRPEWFTGDILTVNMGLARQGSDLAAWFYDPSRVEWLIWLVLATEFIVPVGLFFRKTRVAAVGTLMTFHLFNYLTMNIGLFSLLMYASMVLYFDSDWAERFRKNYWDKRGAFSKYLASTFLKRFSLGWIRSK